MSTIQLVGTILGTVVSLATVLGWIGRRTWRGFVERVNKDIVEPSKVAAFQLTQNGGKNDPKTVPDWMHVIDVKLDGLALHVAHLATEVEKLKKAPH